MTVKACKTGIYNIIYKIILSRATWIIVVLCFSVGVTSAATTTKIPGTIVSSTGVGTQIWVNPQQANASDNSYATSTLAKSQQSNYLNASNFGFTIPAGSTINGITVRVERSGSSNNRVSDTIVRLMKNGVISGNNYAAGGGWGTGDTVITYGGFTDLWGLNWTYQDINNANFGLVFSVSANNPVTANIDYINITINYTAPAENIVLFVNPTPTNNSVLYANSVYANVSTNFNATICQLNWTGTIYDMSGSGTTWYYNRTSLSTGKYYYYARCNDTSGFTNTTMRNVTIATFPGITYADPTPPNAWSTQDTWAYVNTTVSGSDIGSAFINWNYTLVLWLRLNNETGESTTFFKDSSTYGNNATCSGTGCPSYVQSIRGNALNFDRTDDEINVTNSNSLNPPNQITISAWFRINGNSGTNRYIISKPAGATWVPPYATYAVRLDTSNKLQFWINNGSNPSNIVNSTSTYTADNIWRQVVATFNGTVQKLYVNGQLEGTNSLTANISSSTQALYIGTTGRTTTERWNGSLDDIQIFNRTLSEVEINSSYNASAFPLYRNFTNLSVGDYFYTAYIQDLYGGINSTETRLFTVTAAPPDNTPPNVLQVFPADLTQSQNTTQILTCNITDNDEVYNLSLYIWNSTGNQVNTGSNRCYQETANASSRCGGIGNGTYSVSGSWTTSGNAYDGSWSTSATGGSSPNNYIYMTYTKPANALNTSTWQVKDSVATRNLTIPAACWSGPELLLRAQASSSGNYVNWQCDAGGGSWQTIDSDGTNNLVYEEAMYWDLNLSTPTASVGGPTNESNWTFIFPYDGTFTWNCLGYDVSNNYNWSPMNYSITIYPPKVPPSIDLMVITDFLVPDNQIILSAGSTRNVTCLVTATDFNGVGTILNSSATLFYYLNTSSDPDNNNTHYTDSNCFVNETTSDNKTFSCLFPIYYFANNGTWNCSATVYDTDNLSSSNVNDTTINPLYAINLTDGLGFGAVAANAESSEYTANITNLGNMRVNATLQGYAQTIGDNEAMNCSDATFIPAANLRYALSSLPFASKTSVTGGIQLLDLTISKPNSTAEVLNTTYWQVQSTPGPLDRQCEGFVIFTAEAP